MGRLIDAYRLRKAVLDLHDCYNGFSDTYDKACIIDLVDEQPTVEAIEVVRCKDCYYCATEKSFGKVYHYCEAFEQYAEGDLIGVSLQVNPDHYCSWGERREDGNT